jgi:hypothetical protein
MMRTKDVTRGARDPAPRRRRARSLRPNASLDQAPLRFSRIEIVRVGRQVPQRRPTCFEARADRRLLVHDQHRQPPPFGQGVTDPVARVMASQRCTVRRSTMNNVAMAAYEPSPRSYAATTRSRNAMSYPFVIAAVKCSLGGTSSAVRD